MLTETLILVLAVIGICVFALVALLALFRRFYHKVEQGRALIINGLRKTLVTFSGGFVWPIVDRGEYMEISVKTVEIDRRGKEGLICRDNIRADIRVTFFVQVNKTEEDVLKVAQLIGCNRASDQDTLEELFTAKFSEALKTVGKRLDFEQLYTQRNDFKDQIIDVIGKDLNGYTLEDAAIDYVEQTPIELLDPDNILDSEGIRKITEITAQSNARTNDLKQKQRMELGAQNLTADEAVFNQQLSLATAEARTQKEIAMVQARESNEAARLRFEEEKQTQVKRQKVEEEVKLAEEARIRAVAVAEQNRLREIGVEKVRVSKATDLEQVEREREVTLRSIDKEKALEVERKEIADVLRARVMVDKTVAEEEENIKDLRALADARRTKDVAIITAEGEAQEELIKEIKKAEAAQEVAKMQAKKQLTMADADLESADKQARAKIRLSEGIQAEQAATGLAQVRVREAEAVASEKQGLANVKVREAAVAITEREGLTEAEVIKEKLLAEAAGEEQRGLARARVQEAEAVAREKNMAAEASGLLKKAEAMRALDTESRAHEEFRLQLEKQLELALESLKARVEIADKQATVLAGALENAKINIVGGDGQFFDRFIQAVSVGQAIDGVVDSSSTVKSVLSKRLDGSGDLINDIKEMVAGTSSGSIKNLSVAALLGRLMVDAEDTDRTKIQTLIDKARELGLPELAK